MKLTDIKIGQRFISKDPPYCTLDIDGDFSVHAKGTREDILKSIDKLIECEFPAGLITTKVIDINEKMGLVIFEQDNKFEYIGITPKSLIKHFDIYKG